MHPDVWHVLTGRPYVLRVTGSGLRRPRHPVPGTDTTEDFTRSGEYDLIFDIPGNRSFRQCRRALSPDGIYSLVGHDGYGQVGRRWLGSIPKLVKLLALTPFVKQLPRPEFTTSAKKDLMAMLTELLQTGKLRPVVDRTFPLAEVPEAIRYLATGAVQGKVVITV